MSDFSVYVIESEGEYYYSLKGADFMPATQATLFRSKKAAERMIRKAIDIHAARAARAEGEMQETADRAKALVIRWRGARVTKLSELDDKGQDDE